MKKILATLALALAVLAPATANSLYGFGFTFGWDLVHQAGQVLTVDTTNDTTYSGIGFNADIYIGQRLGFYAGGSIGLLTGISTSFDTELTAPVSVDADMDAYAAKTFGTLLAGLGAFLPMGSFDISGAAGFGLDFVSTRLDGAGEASSMFAVGPGVSVSAGVPVSSHVEAYLSCRAILGLILMGDYPDNFRYDLSIAPAIGVRIKG